MKSIFITAILLVSYSLQASNSKPIKNFRKVPTNSELVSKKCKVLTVQYKRRQTYLA